MMTFRNNKIMTSNVSLKPNKHFLRDEILSVFNGLHWGIPDGAGGKDIYIYKHDSTTKKKEIMPFVEHGFCLFILFIDRWAQ